MQKLSERLEDLELRHSEMIEAMTNMGRIIQKIEEKIPDESLKEVKEVIGSQEVIDQLLVENSDKIKLIEKELIEIEIKVNSINEYQRKTCSVIKKPMGKICRHYDRGHCKYGDKCRFTHNSEICVKYLKGEKCIQMSCSSRHPKVCKYWKKNECKREVKCSYLHVTLGQNNRKVNDVEDSSENIIDEQFVDDRLNTSYREWIYRTFSGMCELRGCNLGQMGQGTVCDKCYIQYYDTEDKKMMFRCLKREQGQLL